MRSPSGFWGMLAPKRITMLRKLREHSAGGGGGGRLVPLLILGAVFWLVYIPYRWALLAALADEQSIEVIEEASDGDEALRKSLSLQPDVLVSDLHMPLLDGHEVTRHLREQAPDIKVIINTISENESDLEMALKLGARGYLLKEEAQELVVEAIRYVHCGGILVSPSMAEKLYTERSQTTPTNSAIPELEDDPPSDENTDTMRLSELELDMLVAETARSLSWRMTLQATRTQIRRGCLSLSLIC